MNRLGGKVAIITGAGMGMGRAAAILFAEEGAEVVVVDINAESGRETVKMIREAGGKAIFVKADVSNTDDVKNMVTTAVATYGKLNVLFNNAAIAKIEPLIESSEENFDRIVAVNIKGVWLGMKYAIPEMIKSGGGSIINTASVAADMGERGLAAYTASKGGVLSMSRVAAIEHASQNIRVNVINPGVILTPMTRSQFEAHPELRKKIESITPQGRLGKPEEVAHLALFFASDESSHITGQKLAVDGGIEADSHIH